jgi:hypothetical protein
MASYLITARPTKYAHRPITTTVESLKDRNRWIRLYKANGWHVRSTAVK